MLAGIEINISIQLFITKLYNYKYLVCVVIEMTHSIQYWEHHLSFVTKSQNVFQLQSAFNYVFNVIVAFYLFDDPKAVTEHYLGPH